MVWWRVGTGYLPDWGRLDQTPVLIHSVLRLVLQFACPLEVSLDLRCLQSNGIIALLRIKRTFCLRVVSTASCSPTR